ncbi:MAG TPA: PhnD/SsuA/transferrin family substrate-binding protein [Rhizobiaceae bacterium]|nr:PhnD/SsuA/transferrin family substrate-binding protein [Rhizobiaceae bacterium]
MSDFIAALQMYDWPEIRSDTDAAWASMRDRLRVVGVDAPDALTRDIDMHDVWLGPNLLIAQTCWGPMELGLRDKVQLVGQPSYEGIEGGEGPLYSSAVIMRRSASAPEVRTKTAHGAEGSFSLPLNQFRGQRFAFNTKDSMSGMLAITRDLAAMGESLAIFSERIETGAHRASIAAVAEGRADVATIDCRSWDLAKRLEPAAADVKVVGWTALRKGLPFITAKATPNETVVKMRKALELL